MRVIHVMWEGGDGESGEGGRVPHELGSALHLLGAQSPGLEGAQLVVAWEALEAGHDWNYHDSPAVEKCTSYNTHHHTYTLTQTHRHTLTHTQHTSLLRSDPLTLCPGLLCIEGSTSPMKVVAL